MKHNLITKKFLSMAALLSASTGALAQSSDEPTY